MMFNLFKRLCRHLFILPFQVKRYFPEASMQRIEQAIAASEKNHLGEIRFAVELSLPFLDIVRKKICPATRCGSILTFAGVGHRTK